MAVSYKKVDISPKNWNLARCCLFRISRFNYEKSQFWPFLVISLYRKTSVLDIGKKFRQYGKMKDTFRGLNLAKESVYKLYIGQQDILIPYPDVFWSYRPRNSQNLR